METKTVIPPAFIHALWIGFMLFVITSAWVSEDAYITLRVLDNFFNDYGLRWNIDERVQAYTHPLWLLLHIPLRLIIPNLFVVSIILSVLCTLGATLVTLASARKPFLITAGLLFLPMLVSKSYFDYTSSGLENPLSHLLFALFGYVLLKTYNHPRFWFYCSLSVALAMFNRLDTIILYAPVLAWLVWSRFSQVRWGQVALGALPLVAWLAFSLLYYGFLFPNTKYAKLDTDLDSIRYIRHGLNYARYMLAMDTTSALAILSSITFIVLAVRKVPVILHPLHLFPMCLALGILWYVLYIINIGGDYMIGRFWSLPVFASLWLAYVFVPSDIKPAHLYTAIILLCVLGIPSPVIKAIRKRCPACSIEKGRMIDAKFMFGGNKLVAKLLPLRINTQANHKFVNYGKKLAETREAPYAEKTYYIGMTGYYAGAKITLVDELALADALLARLPVTKTDTFYIGHFRRTIPEGYIYARKTGSTEKMDPSLAKYYEKLRIITSGDLLDTQRLKTIIAFNLGEYDDWKRDYLNCNIW